MKLAKVVPVLPVCVGVLLSSSMSQAHGFPDQVNDPPTLRFFGCSASFPVPASLYQSFTPSRPLLLSVEVRMFVLFRPPTPTVRIRILDGRSDGPVLGEAKQPYPPIIPGPFPTALLHFDFTPPLRVKAGRTYFIAWVEPVPASWTGSDGDPYTSGEALDCGGRPLGAGIDLNFRTLALPRAPRSEIEGRQEVPQEAVIASRSLTWGRLKLLYR